MKQLVLTIIVIALALGLSGITHAEEPLDCAPEDRSIPGNTNSPCSLLFHLEDITTVSYVVLEDTEVDACYEALEFRPYNFTRDFRGRLSFARNVDWDGMPKWGASWWDGSIRATDDSSEYYATGSDEMMRVQYGYASRSNYVSGKQYYFVDSIVPVSSMIALTGTYIQLNTGSPEYQYSEWFPSPVEARQFNSLMNDCIHGLKLRLDAEAEAETLAVQEAQAERERQQALEAEAAEAEADARRLASAQEQLRLAQERELIETRALKARLERDKVIVGIIQLITEERIRGYLERSRITNQYLQEVELNYAEFDTEAQEGYTELNRLETLNQAILETIATYSANIDSQLVAAAELEQANLDRMAELIPEDEGSGEDSIQ